jgi:hypothetical protein
MDTEQPLIDGGEQLSADSALLDRAMEIPPRQTDGGGSAELDDLLAQYDAETKAAIDRSARNAEAQTLDELFDDRHVQLRTQAGYASYRERVAQQKLDELNNRQQEIQRQEALRKHETDLAQLVKNVRGDLDAERFPDDIVTAIIDAAVLKRQDWQQAWLQREQNPQAMAQVERELVRAFHKSAMAVIDPALTEDRDAVAAAVRGASRVGVPETPAPNLGRQSNNEFRQFVKDNYGYDPGV